MIALISPAKSLDFESELPEINSTEHSFQEETSRLVRAASNLSKKKLKAIMPVSDALIDLNYGRYQGFFDQPVRPAIHAFNGDVYTGFEIQSLDENGVSFAQKHLRILSGLYGLLRPLDHIRPYRLEMGTRWAPRYKNLVQFWGDKIAKNLAQQLPTGNDRVVLNLASNEYWAAVEKHVSVLNARIISVDFRQDGPDGPRFQSFAAKRARGMMARYMCEHHITDAEQMKKFDSDGYQFDTTNSDENTWRFIRS